MDSAILSLLGAFLLSIMGLFVFIWSMRKGLLVENPRAASIIFAPGELGKVDDPAIHGNAKERQPGAEPLPGEIEHVEDPDELRHRIEADHRQGKAVFVRLDIGAKMHVTSPAGDIVGAWPERRRLGPA